MGKKLLQNNKAVIMANVRPPQMLCGESRFSLCLPLPSEDRATKPWLRFKQKQSKRGSVQPAVELRSSWLNSEICRVRGRVEKLIGRKQKINCIPVTVLSKRVSPVDFLSSFHIALPDCEVSRVANHWWRYVGGYMEVTCSLSSWAQRLLLFSSASNRINISELFLEAWTVSHLKRAFFQTDAMLSVSGRPCCSWLLRLPQLCFSNRWGCKTERWLNQGGCNAVSYLYL